MVLYKKKKKKSVWAFRSPFWFSVYHAAQSTMQKVSVPTYSLPLCFRMSTLSVSLAWFACRFTMCLFL